MFLEVYFAWIIPDINDRSEVYNIVVSCLNNGLHILNNKNEPKLRLLWAFKFVHFPTKLGVKTSDITKIYGYEYIKKHMFEVIRIMHCVEIM